MTAEEIRAIAIHGSEQLYNYLQENDKGVSEVRVYQIIPVPSKDYILKLRLSAKLFDTEALFFHLATVNKKYETGRVKILAYDRDQNTLVIKPDRDLIEEFSNLRSDDLTVISDLTFLVERVRKWYEAHGARIALPTAPSVLADKVEELTILKKYPPSVEQKKALFAIFKEPFTYIWGAPGTGKTQFVLAYAVMNYVLKGRRVVICAPTNNSLEQVLRGVIKMTDLAGINRNKILRLGNPSMKFAEEYSEVCEVRGIQKQLDEIDGQIKILEKVLQRSEKLPRLQKTYDQLTRLEASLVSYQQGIDQSTAFHAKNVDATRRREVDLRFLNESIEQRELEIAVLEGKKSNFWNRLRANFGSKLVRLNLEIDRLADKLLKDRKEKVLAEEDLEDLRKREKLSEQLVLQARKEKSDFVADLLNAIDRQLQTSLVDSELNDDQLKDRAPKLAETITKKMESLSVDDAITSEYVQYEPADLERSLFELRKKREYLAEMSTEERLKSVQVVCATLDGYIGRFDGDQLRVDHVFLDEAGYANEVKALTLFNQDVPVTFLGDHQQLPPVCELNDREIGNTADFHNVFLWAESAIYLTSLFTLSADEARLNYLNHKSACTPEMKVLSLNDTYRFGPNLANVLANSVYTSSFRSATEKGDTEIIFVHAQKVEGFRSRISSTEVTAIASLAESFRNEGADYVILTPYRKQIQLLGRRLPKERNALQILTVHGSQGREWDTVILSVVDTGDMWFTDSSSGASNGLKLINTAVSRARKQLIIVCDANFWKNQPGQLIADLISVGQPFEFA